MPDRQETAETLESLPGAKREKRPQYGVTSESCSAKELGLHRFASENRFYQHEEKSDYERLLNPFGDKWASRKRTNRYIPTMTGALTTLVDNHSGGEPNPFTATAAAYAQFTNNALVDLHYDESIGHLQTDMARLKRVKSSFQAANIKKRFIGYTVVNFDNNLLIPKSENLPESFYLHNPETSNNPKDRLWFSPGGSLVDGGYVFDTRKAEVRTKICQTILRRLIENDVDGVLIDYAVRRFAFGAPQLIDVLPSSWFENFQETQLKLMEEIYDTVKPHNKLLFLNGVMLDSITVTDPRLVRLYAKQCDGMMWEQPFRWEWRTFDNGVEDYYDRLQQFFDVFGNLKKKLIIKVGSYRFHATEDIEPSWNARFATTNYGIERHLAKHSTCFFLLFYNRFLSALFLSHPTQLNDIYASEAFFNFWDCKIGESLSPRRQLSKHIHAREFEHAVVFINNTLEPFKISPGQTPDGFSSKLPNITLAPLSGEIWVKQGFRVSQVFSLLSARRRLQMLLHKNPLLLGILMRLRSLLRDSAAGLQKTTRRLGAHAAAFFRWIAALLGRR